MSQNGSHQRLHPLKAALSDAGESGDPAAYGE